MSSKKRLAILGTRGIPARYGGFETFAERISALLVQREIDVTVYCEANSENDAPTTHRSVHLRYVPAPRIGPLTTILFDLRCLWQARHGFDVVYMLGYGASIFCFIPRVWGSEVWINMDGIEWARSKWSWLARTWFVTMESLAMWTTSRVIADAGAIQSHLESRHWRMPKCSVIAYGAEIVSQRPDPDCLDKWNVRSQEYYLVVCRLEPENHLQEIIDGFISSTSTRPLLILGDHTTGTPYVRSLQKARDERIRFGGTIYDSTTLQALRWHCRAYFHGHSVGGTNPSLLEAMGCGNLIVAHDNPFNREVADSTARYFRSSSEIPAIVADLDKIDSFEGFRNNSFGRVRQRYTWEKVCDEYTDLLNQV